MTLFFLLPYEKKTLKAFPKFLRLFVKQNIPPDVASRQEKKKKSHPESSLIRGQR